MKLTYGEIKEKHQLAWSLLTKEEAAPGTNSKLKYALQKMDKALKPVREKVQEDMDEINIKYAQEDEKTKTLLTDNGFYRYTRDNEILKRADLKKIDSKEYEFEPYLFSDEARIATIDDFTKEELKGFFLP